MVIERKSCGYLTIIAFVMMVSFSVTISSSSFAASQVDSTCFQTVPDSSAARNRSIQNAMYRWFGRQKTNQVPKADEDATVKFQAYDGKTIANIHLIRLDAFGYSVYDSSVTPTRGIEKVGNTLHIRTAKRIIKNILLFREGDKVIPFEFAETEQLLREGDIFEDANIQLKLLPDTNYVDVWVITKEKWTTSVGVQYSSPEKMKFAVSERNLAGLSLRSKAISYFDKSYSDPWAFQGELDVPNYFGSYISSVMFLRKGHGYDSYAMRFNRDFYASKTKYAGGVMMVTSQEPYRIFTNDSIISISYQLQDWWVGRSIRVSRKSTSRAPFNLVLAARYYRKDFTKAPPVAMYLNPYFHSVKDYLVSLGLSNQNISRSSLYFGFGSTEDIPVGFRIQFSTGIQKSEFQRRFLVGGELSAAEITPLGYLYLSSRIGGYLAEGPRIEQAVINFRAQYFSNLYHWGRNDIRHFIRYDFTRGAVRFNGEREYVVLRNEYGIRGLRSPNLYGQTRLMFNFESMMYSPHYIYGFRPAFFVFADFGIVGHSDKLLYANPLYSGFGLGIRLKNESLIFPTFLFRVGYYPRLPADAEVSYWLISTEARRSFEQFRVREPYILQFE